MSDTPRDPEHLLALHDELDALSTKRSSGGVIAVFAFAAVLYFLLGLDMSSWQVLLGSTLSGLIAGAFVLKDLRRSLRKRELRREMAARSAWDLLAPAPGAAEAPGGDLGERGTPEDDSGRNLNPG